MYFSRGLGETELLLDITDAPVIPSVGLPPGASVLLPDKFGIPTVYEPFVEAGVTKYRTAGRSGTAQQGLDFDAFFKQNRTPLIVTGVGLLALLLVRKVL